MRLTRRTITLSVALTLAFAATACTDNDDTERDPIEISSATPDAPEYDITELSVRPADDESDQGAFAFAEYVTQVIDYAYATNDTDPLFDLVHEDFDCSSCGLLEEDVTEDPDVAIIQDEHTPLTNARIVAREEVGIAVAFEATETPAEIIDIENGEVINDSEGGDVFDIVVEITWDDGAWHLINFSYYELGEIEEMLS